MCIFNTKEKFGAVSRAFHWSIAFLVIAMLIFGFLMGLFEDTFLAGFVYGVHKATGLFILFLITAYILWTFINVKPGYQNQLKTWEKVLARDVHILLFAAVFLMPVLGWLGASAGGKPPTFFGLFPVSLPVPEVKEYAKFFMGLHKDMAWIIIALLALHLAGALKHHFIDKNNILLRMLGRERKS